MRSPPEPGRDELIDLLNEEDNDPPFYELENILTEKELIEYEQIKIQSFKRRINTLDIDALRFLLANIIATTPHIEDNKHLIEYGLIDNEDDQKTIFETMLNKFTEDDMQKKIKLYKDRKITNQSCENLIFA